MTKFTLHLTPSNWTTQALSNGQFMQRGTIWQDTAPLATVRDADIFCRHLQELNGFYAVVRQTPELLMAAVDHIRSIPLFYGQKNGCFFLADDAEWVRQQVGDQEMDPLAREEFQLTGYVTGQDTLFQNVKQLQAGECLIARVVGNNLELATQRYYRFLHTEPSEYDEKKLREKLDEAALASVGRLVEFAAGRQIVVPLSGGYDSRLIVTLLKRLDYKNILTFTYGVKGNKESLYSKRVADSLGLEWHFVEYTRDLWRAAWQKNKRCQYQKWASGWSSVAHVQDWLAVKLLKQKALVDVDCIFVPGHTGDFIAGGHIPSIVFQKSNFSISDVQKSIFLNHYNLAPISTSGEGREHWLERINELLDKKEVGGPCEFADAYEKWEWQERQAKFICNSVRVYEFFGYDWWMPLWDKEFVEFWESVPLELRKEREWYVQYVKEEYSRYSNTQKLVELSNANEGGGISRLKKIWIFKLPLVVRVAKYLFRRKDQLGRDDRLPKEEALQLYKNGYSLNGATCYFFLKDSQRALDGR